MKRASLCIYCGKSIEHPSDPEQIKEIHEILMAHDKVCENNPIVTENKALRDAVELAFAEGFASDKNKDVDTAFNASLTKAFLINLEDITK